MGFVHEAISDVQVLPIWVEYVKALGTPTVALLASIVAAFIAYRQWRTARNKLKLDFFDRRMEIYNCAVQLINLTYYPLPIDEDGIIELANKLDGAHWLLDRKLAAHLHSLAQRCYDGARKDDLKLTGMTQGEKLFAAKLIMAEEKEKTNLEREALDKLFAPFLQVTH